MFNIPSLLSFALGFASLSEEILWVRAAGFAYLTAPPAFSFVLACYLVGIAAGAAFGKKLCASVSNLYAAAAMVLAIAALGDVLTPLIIGLLIRPDGSKLYIAALAIIQTAGLKSILFPIVHHLGSSAQDARVGRSMSRIYFANILGATLGPLATGFIALEHLSVDECFAVVAAICLLLSTVCVLKSGRPGWLALTLGTAVLSSGIVLHFIAPGPGSLLAFMAGGSQSMTHFISNRHGVIHTANTTRGEFVYGGNVYDGIATVNVDTNPNRLDRLYLAALLHPNPKRVLFVGISAGPWVRGAQGFPGVESIDAVEINPGYIELIRSYTQVAGILKDPRVHIHIDDGRRWLRRNPGARYDLIIQNTTYHWRANAGNLLSREYLEEIRSHLSPGGIFTLNTTGSYDALATLQSVFPFAYRYFNFGYASDHPLTPEPNRLLQVRRPDGNLFTFDNARSTSVSSFLENAKLDPLPEFFARHKVDAGIVTDDNLLTEYRHGQRFPPFLRAVLPEEPGEFDPSAP